jgi:hypothetical protein
MSNHSSTIDERVVPYAPAVLSEARIGYLFTTFLLLKVRDVGKKRNFGGGKKERKKILCNRLRTSRARVNKCDARLENGEHLLVQLLVR